ncbi:MAG TPA: DUF4412 domain-containing protein [Chthoniobacterales bacterium]
MLRIVLPFLATLLLGLATASADFIVTHKLEAMGEQATIIVMMKGDQVRLDVSLSQISVVTGQIVDKGFVLFHADKRYLDINSKQVKAILQLTGHQTNPTEAFGKLKATGKKDNVKGYDVEEYIATDGKAVYHLWLTKDHPNGKAVRDALDAVEKGVLKSEFARWSCHRVQPCQHKGLWSKQSSLCSRPFFVPSPLLLRILS